jgi:FMN phosphatase YigB (HAD superfamily)
MGKVNSFERLLAYFYKLLYHPQLKVELHYQTKCKSQRGYRAAEESDMEHNIEAIFLDVGNTLRIVIEDQEFMNQARKDLLRLVGATETEEDFFKTLDTRWKTYRKQSKESLLEASEKELWTQWLLPDYPAEKIAPLAGRLTRLWRDHDGRRVPRSDAKEVIIELSRRGYLLGIIANTITETEIPDWMESEGLTGYFKTVVLSSRVRLRKPNPEIYWLAARQIGVEPSRCVYVGDNPVRDVEGCRDAGFGMMILFMEPATLAKEPPTGEHKADYAVRTCTELLEIFPPRTTAGQDQ